MQIIDTFSGIGGFSIAGDNVGWKTILFCEINPFCQGVLKNRWPNVPLHDNIKTLTFEIIKNSPLYDPNETTIFVGGVPCQPWSLAGKRRGVEDDRNLWPESIKLISEIKPGWVVLENVPGFINWSGGLVFEQVQADLEAEGYEVQPYVLPAASVGAPHRRDRVWFVAHANRNVRSGGENGEYPAKNGKHAQRGAWERDGIGDAAHTDSRRRGEGAEREYDNAGEREVCENEQGYGNEVWSDIGHGLHDGTSPDTASDRFGREGSGAKVQGGEQGPEQGGKLEGGLEGLRVQRSSPNPRLFGQEVGCEQPMGAEQLREERAVANTDDIRQVSGRKQHKPTGEGLYIGGDIKVNAPDTTGEGLERSMSRNAKLSSELFSKRATPDPLCGRQPGEEHGEAGPRWLTEEGLPNDWRDFPTQPPIRRGNDGISEELVRAYIVGHSGGVLTEKEINKIVQGTFSKFYKEAIKAFGNAIVPQVAYQIFKAINEYEKLESRKDISMTTNKK